MLESLCIFHFIILGQFFKIFAYDIKVFKKSKILDTTKRPM